jgi:AcrR family transcriptional regulator
MKSQQIDRPIPKQDRARQRRQRILDAALALVEETGADLMRMADVAVRAQVPIGSVYQFFPDKSEILRCLYKHMIEAVSSDLQAGFTTIASLDDAIERTAATIDAYVQRFRSNFGARELWGGMQADPRLRAFDVADSIENANALFDAIKIFVTPQRHASLRASCLLITHLTGAVVSLCLSLDTEDAEMIIARYKANVARELAFYRAT